MSRGAAAVAPVSGVPTRAARVACLSERSERNPRITFPKRVRSAKGAE